MFSKKALETRKGYAIVLLFVSMTIIILSSAIAERCNPFWPLEPAEFTYYEKQNRDSLLHYDKDTYDYIFRFYSIAYKSSERRFWIRYIGLELSLVIVTVGFLWRNRQPA